MKSNLSWILALCLSGAGALAFGCGGSGSDEAGFSEVKTAGDAGQTEREDHDVPPPWDALPYEAVAADAVDPGPPYPIVLHHGFSGWKEINALGLHYFNGVAEDLIANGEPMVFETVVQPYDGTALRAEQLAPQIDEILRITGKSKVNIVAHSQGGLDSRYIISSLGYGDRVATLTTISTPHHGTALADALFDNVPGWTDPITDAIASVIGKSVLDVAGDADLRASLKAMTEDTMMTSFNPANIDSPEVKYFSYAGRSNDSDGIPDCNGSWFPDDTSKVDHIDALLSLTGSYLKDHGEYGGVNDGIVAVRSARWGMFMGCFPADHFDEIGQVNKTGPNPESGFDHKAFYRTVVSRIRERGY
ncbi:MAG: triacylglycerol lipase [Deltaproteobacteria bacterium]|nr:triacylglycerol lipase [Deltaproteobacteria bacterium]